MGKIIWYDENRTPRDTKLVYHPAPPQTLEENIKTAAPHLSAEEREIEELAAMFPEHAPIIKSPIRLAAKTGIMTTLYTGLSSVILMVAGNALCSPERYEKIRDMHSSLMTRGEEIKGTEFTGYTLTQLSNYGLSYAIPHGIFVGGISLLRRKMKI